MPPSSMSSPAEDPVPQPPIGREEGEKKKKKKVIVKVHRKVHPGGSSYDDDNPREDLFGNQELIQDLTNSLFTTVGSSNTRAHQNGEPLEVRGVKSSGRPLSQGQPSFQGEGDCGRRSVGDAQKRGFHLGGAEGCFGLERGEKKKAEVKVGEMKDQTSKQILETKIQAMKVFKVSSKMRNLNVAFGQEAFQKGYELCKDWVAAKFPKLDLGFLYGEVPDEKAKLSTAATDLSPIKAILEPSEPTIEVPKSISKLEAVENAPTSFAAAPPEV
ncbi:hypothetical protein COCNU_scaffold066104G000010 [Cocos nucifera]|nr:hypothetical protein [Cocos nucifera]